MLVIKRDGSEVIYDIEKIVAAIEGACGDVEDAERMDAPQIRECAEAVERKIRALGHTAHVEEIQDLVEDAIMAADKYELARAYITYRYKRSLARRANTTDERILSLLDCTNEEAKQENANKNPTVVSVQRDYMAGEVSKDLTRRLLLPEDVVKAHDEGLIHFHDADYYSQHMHNCFARDTRFLTDEGPRAFSEFQDGDKVNVIDKDGVVREAVVHNFGSRLMQKVTLTTTRTKREIICTPDHRWILEDGTVTTSLRVGDRLLGLTDTTAYDMDELLSDNHKANLFALGFVVGDGFDRDNGRGNDYTAVRLCGGKVRFADVFLAAGYRENKISDSADRYFMRSGASKQAFLDACGWRYMADDDKRWLFRGYMAADGGNGGKKVATADERVLSMIVETSSLAGYHITRVKHCVHDTNYKKGASYYDIGFIRYQKPNGLWRVQSLELFNKGHKYSAWCVTEPVTHTFTLEGGIITGNCDLLNLEDMLQNGTVISGTKIERPHSFSTACNIATQIIAQVASCQYGGQSFSLAHLSPFVDVSRKKIAAQVERELAGLGVGEDKMSEIVEGRVREEVTRGIQTIQYQIITLMTTNGQAPFVTMFMWLDEVPEGQARQDLALCIEEVLRQRYQGVKNEAGAWITPAFPKLIYALDEDNVEPGTPYWYLTELAAKCTARRMVPDYISAKKMRELKLSAGEQPGEGDVYTCMGCVGGQETVTYRMGGDMFVSEPIENMWKHMSECFSVRQQPEGRPGLDFYVDLEGVEIFDGREGEEWVECRRIIRNGASDMVGLEFSNGRTLTCTDDHPLMVETDEGFRPKRADEISCDDVLLALPWEGWYNDGKEWDEWFDAHDPDAQDAYEWEEVNLIGRVRFGRGIPSYDVTTTSEHFTVSGIWSHNCRSFLTPDRSGNGYDNVANAGNYEPDKPKYYGRFNQGVVTINLPDVALSSAGDMDRFWEIFEERLELCHRALRCRHERLLGTLSDAAPILWQHGALARLNKGETIDRLLYGGYSTISLGYAGLYECVKYMTGKSHTDDEAKPFALAVMQKMNDKCTEWKAAEDIDYSVYGTPLESTTYKFATCLQKRFGCVPGITDHGYITNSYHVNVREQIDAFTKLSFESEFQRLSPGGAISYVEVPNMQDNLWAVLSLMRFIYDNIMYAELNTKSDFCQVCGYDGEIQIVEERGKLVWECPSCGNRDQSKMNVARRTCGYIGTQYWNQGRTEEIRDRVLHL